MKLMREWSCGMKWVWGLLDPVAAQQFQIPLSLLSLSLIFLVLWQEGGLALKFQFQSPGGKRICLVMRKWALSSLQFQNVSFQGWLHYFFFLRLPLTILHSELLGVSKFTEYLLLQVSMKYKNLAVSFICRHLRTNFNWLRRNSIFHLTLIRIWSRLLIIKIFFRMKPGAPRATTVRENNARSGSEVVYPFGVQNDLGHVVLTRNAKVSYKIVFENLNR